MAEDTEDSKASKSVEDATGSWWNSWGQGWVDAVKEKTAVTLEMVKKDLNEFVDVVQGDTSTAIGKTADILDEDAKKNEESRSTVVKKGLSKFLHTVSDYMTVEPDDSKDEVITISDSFSTESYDRKQEKIFALQTDPGTYCNEPEPQEMFLDWLDVFNLDDHKHDMSDMLIKNNAVRAIYTQLVPSVLSHAMFWQRYFYHVFLFEAEEKRRKDLLARASEDPQDSANEEGNGWEDEDDDIIVLPPISTSPPSNQEKSDEALNKKNSSKYPNTELNEVKEDKLCDNNALTNPVPTNTLVENLENVQQSETQQRYGEALTLNIDASPEDNVEEKDIIPKIEDNPSINDCSSLEKQNLDNNIQTLKNQTADTNAKDNQNSESNKIPTSESLISKVPSCIQNIQKIHNESLETSSVGSWISIDDEIRVKIAGEQDLRDHSKSSTDSLSGTVIVNKDYSDSIEIEEDFNIDLDDDADDEELERFVQDIKIKASSGVIKSTKSNEEEEDDDDDWENWE